MQREIEPHVPLLDREHQTNGFFIRASLMGRKQPLRYHSETGSKSRCQRDCIKPDRNR
jgi:hypothetical protein